MASTSQMTSESKPQQSTPQLCNDIVKASDDDQNNDQNDASESDVRTQKFDNQPISSALSSPDVRKVLFILNIESSIHSFDLLAKKITFFQQTKGYWFVFKGKWANRSSRETQTGRCCSIAISPNDDQVCWIEI